MSVRRRKPDITYFREPNRLKQGGIISPMLLIIIFISSLISTKCSVEYMYIRGYTFIQHIYLLSIGVNQSSIGRTSVGHLKIVTSRPYRYPDTC